VSSNVHSRALVRAAELAGSRDALAGRLGVERARLDEWIVGKKRPGMPLMLRVVGVILDEMEEDELLP
jgi:DNA-binding transcriptional regulator YdaS (Cro superfamily)